MTDSMTDESPPMLPATEILNARILVVDDQAANVLLLEKILRDVGYRNVHSTMNPQTVLGLHREQDFDLILLDLLMPQMDGFEVMQQIAALDPDGYVPVLVITAQPGHRLRALKAGAKDFIGKPFDLAEVQTRIHNMLEVRLLYRKLQDHNQQLERAVAERTAELAASEARFRNFARLSADWYWEQDAEGRFVEAFGPAMEMLGLDGAVSPSETGRTDAGVWNARERAVLDANIAARKPFTDLLYSRRFANGEVQYLRVSGEPILDVGCRFAGYRGVGSEVSPRVAESAVAMRV